MDTQKSVSRVVDLTEDDRAAVTQLTQIVYPPHEWADWPGRLLEWSDPEWCVRLFADDAALTCFVGIVLRDAIVGGRSERVGGVGGVKTHPAYRGLGYARAGVRIALDFFRQQPDVQFALLVCEPHLLQYYSGLGWQEFDGELLVRQHGHVVPFTFNRVMTHPVRIAAPRDGIIDLCGPPW